MSQKMIDNVGPNLKKLCYGSTAIRNIFYFYRAGIDFSRQNLTSTDVRF